MLMLVRKWCVCVRDVHTEMVSAEFMCGNFVVYRLNINTLHFKGTS